MKFIYNNPLLKGRRKELRHKQTNVEKILWSRLRNKQLSGYKFYRQYSIGYFILDFYCPNKKLAIELDGSQHKIPKNRDYDLLRSEYIKQKDITILRFWDNEVTHNIEGILTKIFDVCNAP